MKKLKILRSFLIKSPPILTLDLELGNLRMNDHNNFIYSDFDEFIGKYTNFGDVSIILGARFNDEIYYYMSRGLLSP
jgi:hypothetical protein